MKISLVPAFEDNYIFVMEKDGHAAVVDPGDGLVTEQFLTANKLQLSDILLTHHHSDHIGGVEYLCRQFNPTVHGHSKDARRLPPLDVSVGEGDGGQCLGCHYDVYEVPGHTVGHIIYHFPELKIVFVGDTLFNHGCGRMFEGTPEVFWQSLTKIRNLPVETSVYCAHEYTLANLNFAMHLEPDNIKLRHYERKCQEARAQGRPTVPFQLGEQIQTNPFLRCDERNMMERTESHDARETFAAIRKAKDQF